METFKHLLWWGMALLAGGAVAMSAVSVHARVIDRDEVAHQVSQQLQIAIDLDAALNDYNAWLQIARVSVPRAVDVDDKKKVKWHTQILPGSLEVGTHQIPVSVLVDDEEMTSMMAAVTLEQWIKVPVLAEGARRGDLITEAQLVWRPISIQQELRGYQSRYLVREVDEVVGKMVQRSVRPNQPLQQQWFKLPLAVKRGEKVAVSLEEKGMSIRVLGEAMQEGAVGESIQILNPESSRRFVAKIVAPGHVRVSLF
jgi:flagella basal body P-ring formation protein FlgA